jgi:hypothetical protein
MISPVPKETDRCIPIPAKAQYAKLHSGITFETALNQGMRNCW